MVIYTVLGIRSLHRVVGMTDRGSNPSGAKDSIHHSQSCWPWGPYKCHWQSSIQIPDVALSSSGARGDFVCSDESFRALSRTQQEQRSSPYSLGTGTAAKRED